MKKEDQQESGDLPQITPDKIEAFRKKKGLTQQELANALGVRASTVSDWENGKGRPTGTAKMVLMALAVAPILGPLGAVFALPLYKLLSEVFRQNKEGD